MVVIRSRDDYGVNVAPFFQHDAVVFVPFRLRVFLENAPGFLPIHVANRDDVVSKRRCRPRIVPALARDTDDRDIEFLVGR